MMNASAAISETEYRRQSAELTRQFEELNGRYESMLKQRDDMKEKGIIFGGILFELKELDELPITFKDSLWHTLADHVTIYSDERIVFTFKDRTKIVTML